MKKIFTLIMIAGSLTSFSQSSAYSKAPIQLKKGLVITAVNSNDMSMDMGMGGEIKNNTTLTTTIEVTDVMSNSYKITNTTTKAKVSMDAMGQESSYDSENPGDPESELTKTFGEKIGKSEFGMIDMNTGIYSTDKKSEESEGNPLQSIFGGLDDKSGGVSDAFFALPQGKKIGDNWSTTDSSEGVKVHNTYTLNSIEEGIATIGLKTEMQINKDVEVQNMSMTIAMTNNGTGTISVDSKTGIVKKRMMTTEMEGSLDVMGQSNPISAKGTNETTYTY